MRGFFLALILVALSFGVGTVLVNLESGQHLIADFMSMFHADTVQKEQEAISNRTRMVEKNIEDLSEKSRQTLQPAIAGRVAQDLIEGSHQTLQPSDEGDHQQKIDIMMQKVQSDSGRMREKIERQQEDLRSSQTGDTAVDLTTSSRQASLPVPEGGSAQGLITQRSQTSRSATVADQQQHIETMMQKMKADTAGIQVMLESQQAGNSVANLKAGSQQQAAQSQTIGGSAQEPIAGASRVFGPLTAEESARQQAAISNQAVQPAIAGESVQDQMAKFRQTTQTISVEEQKQRIEALKEKVQSDSDRMREKIERQQEEMRNRIERLKDKISNK